MKAKKENNIIESNRMNLLVGDLNEEEIEMVLNMQLSFNNKTKKWDGDWVTTKNIIYFINKEGKLTLPLGEIHNLEIIGANLTSLYNMPIVVSGDFNVSNNKLTSLEYAPTEIGNDFKCSDNMIESLEDLSSTLLVYGFECNNNKLTNMKGCPCVSRYIQCNNNPLTTLKGLPKELNSISTTQNGYTFNANKTRLKNYAHIAAGAINSFNITSLYKISEAEMLFVKNFKVKIKNGTEKHSSYISDLNEKEYYLELANFMVEAELEELAEEIWWHEDVLPNIQNLFSSVKTINKFSL